MKLLIDNQLPPELARYLIQKGLEAIHVREVGLSTAADREIWDYCQRNDCCIVSKDEDFLHLSKADPSGPAFVWIRTGNCRTAALTAVFERVLPALLQALRSGDKVIEIR